jgi:general secretion pathway protein D
MNSIIRLSSIAALIVSLSLGASASHPSWAQSNPTKQRPTASLPAVTGNQLVSIDFNNVDIVVFIKFISDLTKKNFVVDEKVRGKVTIISPGKITVDEAYQVFLSVLEVHDYTIVPAGEIIKIVPSPDARGKSIKTRLKEEAMGPSDDVVTQIVPLHYADPNEIKQLFTPLISRNSVILAYAPTNTLIITDVQSNIKRLMRILRAIDITGVGQQIAIIPVEYADATKLVTLLESIFTKGPKARRGSEKDITFVADERTNAIVLLASEGDADNIRKLIKSLDKETPRGQANIHVYYLEHANAEDLASVLKDIPQQKGTSEKAQGKKSTPVISENVRIAADKATNSLIITADQEDYVVLENIIKKVDIPRAMVYIEAAIMEVNVDKDFRLGTDWLAGGEAAYNHRSGIYGGGFSAGGFGGDAGTVGTTAAAAGFPLPAGFSMGLIGESITIGNADDGTLIRFPTISALVQAYKKDNDVQILSNPQILTTDNQEAKIYVGRNVPFQTTATASSTGTEVYNSFEYRDVGKTLKITPQISKDRMVRLQLSLEVSDLQSTTDFRPTTLKRTVETTAIVKDGNTVVLGGLIDNSISNTDYRVPCLGSIPILGWLFRNSIRGNSKTNLYIFLTPRVIQNPEEATAVSSKKRKDIDKLREEDIKLYKHDDMPPATDEWNWGNKPNESKVESFQYRQKLEPPTEEKPVSADQPAPPVTVGAQGDGSTVGGVGSDIGAKAPPSESGVQDRPSASETAVSSDAQKSQSETPSMEAQPVPSAAVSPGKKAADASKLQPHANAPTRNKIAGYTIQVASVESVEQADKILKQLTDRGYPAYTVQTTVGNQVWYRIRIGYYDSPDAPHDLMEKLREDQFKPILIEF